VIARGLLWQRYFRGPNDRLPAQKVIRGRDAGGAPEGRLGQRGDGWCGFGRCFFTGTYFEEHRGHPEMTEGNNRHRLLQAGVCRTIQQL